MRVLPTAIDGLLVIEPVVHEDARGWFCESWNAARFAEAGLSIEFVQDNHSRSRKGVLRGLHFQQPNPQGKLVRVVSGAVFDVAVDLRVGSPTYGVWEGIELSADNRRMAWIPRGFAHGFLALEDGTDVLYKCDAPWSGSDEHTLAWDDPDLAIDWPLGGAAPILSEKDASGKTLQQVEALA
ncbi:MAG: dTDP-4-dehydrorhamnose 3,5-epimerase [Alteraurantiacibacter sp.]